MKISYNKLWKLLIDKDLNRNQLGKIAGISTNAIAKLGKNEAVNLEILLKICSVLNCNLCDVCDFVKDKQNEVKQ